MTFGFVLAVCVAAAALACGGSTTVTEITGPSGTAARCQTAIASSTQSIPASGGSVSATVSAARECSWSATSDASWVQVAPANGQGAATITVTVAENPLGQSRSAAVVVNDGRLNLSQEPAPCRFEAGNAPRMSHTGGRATISVSATDGCDWAASSSADWVRILSGSGRGNGSVQLEVAANPGGSRSATLTVAGQTRTLTQDARSEAPGPNPPPPPPPPDDPDPPPPVCSISIDPADRSFGPDGGDGSFRVQAPRGCRWDATVDVPWIQLSRSSGDGNENVSYTIDRNTGTDSRTGVITVSGSTHTVRQEGAPAPPPDDDDDDDDDGGGRKVELSGRVWGLRGTCPQVGFAIGIQGIVTDGDTKFKGGSCADLRNFMEVEVEGRRAENNWIRATDVRIRDDDNDD